MSLVRTAIGWTEYFIRAGFLAEIATEPASKTLGLIPANHVGDPGMDRTIQLAAGVMVWVSMSRHHPPG
jgi:hypothetical protein